MDYFCSSEYLDLVMENEDHKVSPEYAKVCDFQLSNGTKKARLKSLDFL